MQSTSTLVLVFTLFTAATTFGKFELDLKLLSVRLLSAVLAFSAVAIVSWEPRALESTEIIEVRPSGALLRSVLFVYDKARLQPCAHRPRAGLSRRSRWLRSRSTAR